MIKLIEKRSWSNELLIPLTGLKKSKFPHTSYLFWGDNTIEDYKLTVVLSREEEVLEYCRKTFFPTLDRKGYLMESYDMEGMSIFVLDMSEWAMDVEIFMKGKYSRLSKIAKGMIEDYHAMEGNRIGAQLISVLYPHRSMPILDNMTPIEYISRHYGLDISEVKKIGEVGSLYNVKEETLIT